MKTEEKAVTMEGRKEEIKELLAGAYDMHVHSSPDVEKRKMSDDEILEDAEAAGMAGVFNQKSL